MSVGMYDKGDGHVVIQAEANPEFIKDAAAWEAQVQKVAADVSAKLGTHIKPEFRDAGFTYFQEPKEVVPTEVAAGAAAVITNTETNIGNVIAK